MQSIFLGSKLSTTTTFKEQSSKNSESSENDHREFKPALRALFLANVMMFIQITISLILLKDYYKYDSP